MAHTSQYFSYALQHCIPEHLRQKHFKTRLEHLPSPLLPPPPLHSGSSPSGPDSHPPSNSTGPDTAVTTPTPPRSGGAGNGAKSTGGTKSAGGTKSGGFGIFKGMADRARQKKLKASFIQEMRTTSALRHPNVTTVRSGSGRGVSHDSAWIGQKPTCRETMAAPPLGHDIPSPADQSICISLTHRS